MVVSGSAGLVVIGIMMAGLIGLMVAGLILARLNVTGLIVAGDGDLES